MKKLLTLSNSIKFFLLIAIAVLSGNCEKPPTEGTIRVVFAGTDNPIEGAKVKIFVESDADAGFWLCDFGYVKEQTYITDGSGQITECFKHPALLNVEATYTDGSAQEFSGEGKLSLMEHETTSVTIKMN